MLHFGQGHRVEIRHQPIIRQQRKQLCGLARILGGDGAILDARLDQRQEAFGQMLAPYLHIRGERNRIAQHRHGGSHDLHVVLLGHRMPP